jgi:hypothetical protein
VSRAREAGWSWAEVVPSSTSAPRRRTRRMPRGSDSATTELGGGTRTVSFLSLGKS